MITKFTVLTALQDLIAHRQLDPAVKPTIPIDEAKRRFLRGESFEIQSGELDGIYAWLILEGPSLKKCKRWAVGPKNVAWALLQEYGKGVCYCDT